MEFSIQRQFFLDQLNLVNRGIMPHSPVPVLGGILFQVEPHQIVLTGSDKEFVVQTTIVPDEKNGLVIEASGSMVMDAKFLLELVRRMNGNEIKVVSDGEIMRLSSLDGNFDLIGRSGADYPPLALERPSMHFQLPAALLTEIYDRTAYAVAEKDSRQVLMGINLEISQGTLAATATDSYRLARKVCPVDIEEECRITIPKQPFGDIVRSFGNHEMIDIYLDRRKIQFVFGNTLMQTQLYEGTFPDAGRIIPTQFLSTLKLSASDLEGMLNRTTIYTSSGSSYGSIVPVQMVCSAQSISMRVLSSDIGSCKQILNGSDYQGQDLSVSYNAKLMLEALKGLRSSDEVELGFTGELRPIRISNPADPTLTMIVVPIRSN